jgi:NTE family protein
MRIGLVLGAGGIAGHGFHAGVLSAIAEATGWDPREAEVVVGTSAGAQVGAYLRAGFSAADLAAHAMGERLSPAGRALEESLGPAWTKPLPRGRRPFLRPVASAQFLARAALRPASVRSGTVLAAMLPRGSVPTELISDRLSRIFGDTWPSRALWLNAVRLDTGRRVVFGRGGAPRTDVASAVAASCSIPSYFAPVRIADDLYVDGGAWSHSNLDLAAGLDLDLVVTIAPMAIAKSALRSPAVDLPGRALLRRRLAGEAAKVRAAGTPVIAFCPTVEDLRAMGLNAMNPRRRRPVTMQAYASTMRRLERPDMVESLAALRAPAGAAPLGATRRPPS